MTTEATITHLKGHLSALLDLVKSGQTLVVTDHVSLSLRSRRIPCRPIPNPCAAWYARAFFVRRRPA